jgi:hypothetical protein
VNPVPSSITFRARQSRRAAIETFFLEHLGERFSTMLLHGQFGTSFRARVSEINRSPVSSIQILNKTSVAKEVLGQPREVSVYWAQLRGDGRDASGQSDYMSRINEEQAQAMPLFAGVVQP